jgi:hypothetical protein
MFKITPNYSQQDATFLGLFIYLNKINNKFKTRCFLLAVVWNYITMHGHMSIKFKIILVHGSDMILVT